MDTSTPEGTGGAIPSQDLGPARDINAAPPAPGEVRLFNTQTRQLEPLETVEEGVVRMYVCGISVSGPPHVGHGRSYVVFDVLRRVLEHAGYEVRHVQNFTDIEEPIVRRAREQGLEPAEYADRMERAYFDAMDRLNVLRADRFPHVTAYIDDIIEATETLHDHECAYPIPDGIAFRICDVEGYGELLGRDPAQAVVHTVDEEKTGGRESPFDFILWRNWDDVGVTWKTPWGQGRPGWHTECAVMATDLLGPTIDIHGGGTDLIFPHHECERAIARCLNGEDFANTWIHNGLVTLEDDKMSKSLRNTVPLNDAIDTHGGAGIRASYLLVPYRETVEWSDALIQEGHRVVAELLDGLEDAQGGDPGPHITKHRDRFLAALRDDLDTPTAIEHLTEIASSHRDASGARGLLVEALRLLGFGELDPFADEIQGP